MGTNCQVGLVSTKTIISWLRDALHSDAVPSDVKKSVSTYLDNSADAKSVPLNLIKIVHGSYCNGHSLHEIIQGSTLCYPEVPVRKRNPELEARVQKLKAQQEQIEYNKMIRNVATKNTANRDESLGYQYKMLNRQLCTIFNTILTVVCIFIFGYKATEFILEKPDVIYQTMVGLILGTVVFIADLYFIVKNEM